MWYKEPWTVSQDQSQINALSLDRLYDVGQFNPGSVYITCKMGLYSRQNSKDGTSEIPTISLFSQT